MIFKVATSTRKKFASRLGSRICRLIYVLRTLSLVTILSGREINNFAGQSAKSVCYKDVLQLSGRLAGDVKELRNGNPTRDLQMAVDRVVLQVSNADKFVAERLSCVLRLLN